MKKLLNIIIPVLVLASLSQCVTAYQATGFTGGYNETQLDSNVFVVSFKGNGYTSSTRAADFCLLRCAELCKQNGYDYFVIVDSDSYTKTVTTTSPTSYNSNYTTNTYGNTTYLSGTTRQSGGQSMTFNKPRNKNTIICLKGTPPNDGVIKYKPEFLIKSIKEKYKIN